MDKPETAYLTKRSLKKLSSEAFQEASENAMEVAGYVLRAEQGWLVREDADGSVRKLKKLPRKVDASEIILD